MQINKSDVLAKTKTSTLKFVTFIKFTSSISSLIVFIERPTQVYILQEIFVNYRIPSISVEN